MSKFHTRCWSSWVLRLTMVVESLMIRMWDWLIISSRCIFVKIPSKLVMDFQNPEYISSLRPTVSTNTSNTYKNYLWTHHHKHSAYTKTPKSQTVKTKPSKCYNQFYQSNQRQVQEQVNQDNKLSHKSLISYNQKHHQYSPYIKFKNNIQPVIHNLWIQF